MNESLNTFYGQMLRQRKEKAELAKNLISKWVTLNDKSDRFREVFSFDEELYKKYTLGKTTIWKITGDDEVVLLSDTPELDRVLVEYVKTIDFEGDDPTEGEREFYRMLGYHFGDELAKGGKNG